MTSAWLNRYRLALRFASFFDSDHRYDIVHDAYVYYLDKQKDDLFEIDLKNESSFIYTVIKKSFYRWYYKERKGDKYIYFPTDVLSSGTPAPDDELIGKDLYEIFYKRLALNINTDGNNYLKLKESEIKEIRNKYIPRKYGTPRLAKEYKIGESTVREILNNKEWGSNKISNHSLLEIFRLKAGGYTQKEISDQLEVSKQLVNQYVKKIEEMANYTNPFNGSRTQVKKKISESAWEKRGDREDFELEDSNEYCFLYFHKESKEGWLVTIKNPKGAEFYIKNLENSPK